MNSDSSQYWDTEKEVRAVARVESVHSGSEVESTTGETDPSTTLASSLIHLYSLSTSFTPPPSHFTIPLGQSITALSLDDIDSTLRLIRERTNVSLRFNYYSKSEDVFEASVMPNYSHERGSTVPSIARDKLLLRGDQRAVYLGSGGTATVVFPGIAEAKQPDYSLYPEYLNEEDRLQPLEPSVVSETGRSDSLAKVVRDGLRWGRKGGQTQRTKGIFLTKIYHQGVSLRVRFTLLVATDLLPLFGPLPALPPSTALHFPAQNLSTAYEFTWIPGQTLPPHDLHLPLALFFLDEDLAPTRSLNPIKVGRDEFVDVTVEDLNRLGKILKRTEAA